MVDGLPPAPGFPVLLPARARACAALLGLALASAAASAAELRVMISAGFHGVYAELAPAFEKASGHRLVTVRGPSMGDSPEAIPTRLARGEAADLVILDGGSADDLAARGVVRADTRTLLALSQVGMVVRAGAPKPDIGTVEAFRKALLAAPSIAYSDSGSGTYIGGTLYAKLGIAEQVAAKSRKVRGPPSGEPVAAVVARGEAAIGFQQLSELIHVPGVDFVGAIPAELQPGFSFAAAVPATAREPEAALALVRFLGTPAANAVITRLGLTPVPAAVAAAPRFRVDPAWPAPLPQRWILGQVSGIATGPDDHVWMLQRPGSLSEDERGAALKPPPSKCCLPAPPVLEFDPQGRLVRAWGGPGNGYDWPQNEHGIHVDAQGQVWITGNGANDGQVLKFTREGRFLMQIGKVGPQTGNADLTRLGRAAQVDTDAEAGEVYVADGYHNRRVIVFDAASGAYKRHWGAYGRPPSDALPPESSRPAPPTPEQLRQFGNPVHCVKLSNDGLVYVCDRINNRVQVFRKDGSFVKEFSVEPRTAANGAVWDLVLSRDPQQRYLFMADGRNNQVLTLLRETGEVIGTLGRPGRYAGEFHWVHDLAIDSQGNLYAGEVDTGKRAQKFSVQR